MTSISTAFFQENVAGGPVRGVVVHPSKSSRISAQLQM